MRYLGASVSAVIAAPVEAVWDLVSDPTRHPAFAGSGEVRKVQVVGEGLMGPGAVFEAQQRMRGVSYVTANRTVIWDPPYRFAWRVGFRFAPGVAQIWMFSLVPEAGGTRVENSVVLPYAFPAFWPFSQVSSDVGRREAMVMAPTLANLAELLGAPPPTHVVDRFAPPETLSALLPPAILQGALLAGIVGSLMLGLSWLLRRA